MSGWLQLFSQLARLGAAVAELRLRRIALDEYKKLDDESNELENTIRRFRQSGADAAADKLLFRQAAVASLRRRAAARLSIFDGWDSGADPLRTLSGGAKREVGQPESVGEKR